jgi:hypothetical protein
MDLEPEFSWEDDLAALEWPQADNEGLVLLGGEERNAPKQKPRRRRKQKQSVPRATRRAGSPTPHARDTRRFVKYRMLLRVRGEDQEQPIYLPVTQHNWGMNFSRSRADAPGDWPVDKVVAWLKQEKLDTPEVLAWVAQEDITGPALLDLTEEHLRAAGLRPLGLRMRLCKAVEALKPFARAYNNNWCGDPWQDLSVYAKPSVASKALLGE